MPVKVQIWVMCNCAEYQRYNAFFILKTEHLFKKKILGINDTFFIHFLRKKGNIYNSCTIEVMPNSKGSIPVSGGGGSPEFV